MTLENETQLDRTVQWAADKMRVLKAGLRSHDDAAVGAVLGDFAKRFGDDFSEEVFVKTVNKMIDEEGFSFTED